MSGLDQRILDEREAGFIGVVDAELALRDQFDACVREHFANLDQFAGVAARENDALHGNVAQDAQNLRA